MPRLIVVLESRTTFELERLLNNSQGGKVLPEGVKKVTKGVWIVEFPKCAAFFSKLLSCAQDSGYDCDVFEIASPSEWEFKQLKNP